MKQALQAAAMDWTTIRTGTHDIPLELIRESVENARKTFTLESVASLAESLREQGQVSAVQVAPAAVLLDGACFELIDGARRFRAMKTIDGATTIRAEVRPVDSVADLHRQMLVTTIQREDVNPLELGAAWRREMELGGYASVKDMAAAFGKSEHERSIYDMMALNKLIPDAAAALVEERITLAHAVLIARKTDAHQQLALAACFERETLAIGLLPEESLRLISVKALRAWIASHLRETESDEDTAKKIAEKRVEAEKRSDGERALEREGERLAGDDKQHHAEAQRSAESAENDEEEDEDDDSEDMPDDSDDSDIVTPIIATADEQNAREIVDELCSYIKREFPGSWQVGVRIDAVICSMLQELKFEREERRLWMLDFKESVNTPKKNRARKQAAAAAVKFTEDEIDCKIHAAAKYIVDAMEIDDTDLTSMREQGMSDAGIESLLYGHFHENEMENAAYRRVDDFCLVFNDAMMKLSTVYEQDITSIEGEFYIRAIRAALEVPDAVDMADIGSKGTKRTKKTKAKK